MAESTRNVDGLGHSAQAGHRAVTSGERGSFTNCCWCVGTIRGGWKEGVESVTTRRIRKMVPVRTGHVGVFRRTGGGKQELKGRRQSRRSARAPVGAYAH